MAQDGYEIVVTLGPGNTARVILVSGTPDVTPEATLSEDSFDGMPTLLVVTDGPVHVKGEDGRTRAVALGGGRR